ncbi:amino acid ABC transporter permease [Enterococcus sp. RIT-PI-f]|uniref:amino acid ABC transporter permease n=1 Tax=Enterococcus sp. RIT-PI-f TaxID=1690244 RepID=UPI0006B8E13C|nr:amino acid ABC transporter permease [Enterococcus sp. RIT-PI-f]KPG71302.1 amino acid ABC transporter permease [Enterococcus sp. RIT-PI-f]
MADFIHWDIVQRYFVSILKAFPLTVLIVAVACLIGFFLGAIVAIIRVEKVPIANQIVIVFVSFLRGTPILVQLFVVFYGLPVLLETVGLSIEGWSKLTYVFIAYGLNCSAFFSEIIRGAILAIPKGQIEAARSIGLSQWRCYSRIVLPQAFRIAIPNFGVALVGLLQDTSLAFSLGIVEVMGKVRSIAALTYRNTEVYLIAAIIFIVASYLLKGIFQWIDQRIIYEY